MHWLALFTGLSVVVIALVVVGSLYSVAVVALGAPAALVVTALTALVVAVLTVYGVRAADQLSTPYW